MPRPPAYLAIAFAIVLIAQFIILFVFYLPATTEPKSQPVAESSARLDRIKLTDEQLQHLASLSKPELLKIKGDYMAPMMITRVADTPGNTAVRKFIVKTLKNLGWKVQLDEFSDDTPLGTKKFANIIADKAAGKTGQKRLLLAAHYDSKYFGKQEFIGALDSVVSCAMLLDIARVLGPMWEKSKQEMDIQLVFFDGEEAFVQWSAEDSVYGARYFSLNNSRHLAQLWEKQDKLKDISVFMLLDLLGGRGDEFIPMLEASSAREFTDMRILTSRLERQRLLKHNRASMFAENLAPSWQAVDDDHRPFKERGVRVLHMIPVPFPVEWHTLDDNADAVDEDVVADLALIVRAFVAQEASLLTKKSTNWW